VQSPFLLKECEMVRAELQAIVCSPLFRNSKRYPAFLTYIVEKALQGESNGIKERTIGIDVFGRPADYDTNSDPIVRNTASEVRRRLSFYHAEAATDRPVNIYLPAGSYHPELRFAASTPSTTGAEPPFPVALNTVEKPPPSLESDAQRRGSSWGVWTASLLVLLLGVGSWRVLHAFRNRPTNELWAEFLNPAQTVLIDVPQAPAPSTLDGRFMKGPLDHQDIANWIKDNPDIAAEDLFAIIRVLEPLMEHQIPYRLQIDSSTTLADLRDRPVILIGGPTNPWTTKLLAPLRFHFSAVGSLHVEDSQNPSSQQWAYRVSNDGAHATVVEDCSIIARYHDPTTGGIVMVLAGAGRNGTEAAGEFVGSKTLLQELNRRLPAGWKNRNLEVVLKATVIDGNTASPSIVATYLW
jgi:hypothetical protein